MKSGKVMCFRCHKPIEEKSDYYAFSEYKKDVFIRTDYAHRYCWDDFLKKLGDTTEAMSIIRQLKGKLTTMGVLDPEEVYIK